MTVILQATDREATRKRRSHRKSRAGCQNCKLRRVKCDEGRPSCAKCIAYGVTCGSAQNVKEDMQSLMTGTFQVNMRQDEAQSLDDTITSLILSPPSIRPSTIPDTDLLRTLKADELDLLSKFQERTVHSLGSTNSVPAYQRELVRLATSAPYLLHIVMTLTLMHDRYLVGSQTPKQSSQEVYHWMQGTALLNKALSQPLQELDRDALWASAALLGAVAFACIDARTPEEAWPLREPSPNDLEWLKMSDGKKEVWKVADPLRQSGRFSKVGHNHLMDFACMSRHDIDIIGLPPGFTDLFDIDATSNCKTNPYHAPVAILSRLFSIKCTQDNIIKFLSFVSFVQPEYKALLMQKDPRALLLLAYWFGAVCEYDRWWLIRRAHLECQSICIFLERYHWHHVGIMKLLHYPRKMCGLLGFASLT